MEARRIKATNQKALNSLTSEQLEKTDPTSYSQRSGFLRDYSRNCTNWRLWNSFSLMPLELPVI